MAAPAASRWSCTRIRGFWLLYWYQSAKPDEITAMFGHLAPLIAAGTISTPVAATYGFDQVREAITKAAQSGGKVLFTPKTRSSQVSAPLKDDLVAEPTSTVIEESRHARSHVFTLEEWRRDFVDNPVRRSDTSVEIRSHDPLAGGIRQGWAVRQSFGECPSLRFKCVIGNNPIDDVPPLERRSVVLVGGIDDFACTAWPGALGEALNAAEQSRGADRCLGLPEAGGGGRPDQIADRKSTRLNSSHSQISYAVFC